VTFLARWPADRAMQHARDRIRELTGRRWLLLRPEVIAQDVNAFLRGWAAYFRYGHSAQRLSKIRQYARMRLALFISKKHRRSRAFGWRVMLTSAPGELGLISLYGIVVAPRAGKPWRERPNAGGERRRCAVCGRTACTVPPTLQMPTAGPLDELYSMIVVDLRRIWSPIHHDHEKHGHRGRFLRDGWGYWG
jgi:Group II intron, maturase-specific domain